jgi:hypothetical protein
MSDAPPCTVMIGSTCLDLPQHREEIRSACEELGCLARMMEHLPASEASAVCASLALVDEADIYIGVFGYRYGYVPKGETKSITHLEYERACQRGIPILIFLMDINHRVVPADIETGEGAERLRALKTDLKTGHNHVVNYFRSAKDLHTKVLLSLGMHLRTAEQGHTQPPNPRPQLIAPPPAEVLDRIRQSPPKRPAPRSPLRRGQASSAESFSGQSARPPAPAAAAANDSKLDPILPFDAFVGPDPFLFVSYSHLDAALVYPEIAALHGLGYRIWYDEGICPGSEWPEEVAAALLRAAFFLVFVSPRAIKSANVRNEINLALAEDKPFLAIHLEETELTGGMKLQMGSRQAILRYRLDEPRYRRRLHAGLPVELRDQR